MFSALQFPLKNHARLSLGFRVWSLGITGQPNDDALPHTEAGMANGIP